MKDKSKWLADAKEWVDEHPVEAWENLIKALTMDISEATLQEVLATLLRISERLERLEAIEALLRAQLEQRAEDQALRRRMLAALSLVVGNNAVHDD